MRHFSKESDFAACAHEVLFDETFGHDDVGEGIDQRDVRAWAKLQVMSRLDVRCAHEVDAARIGDDQARALAQAALHHRGEHRMPSVGLAPVTNITSAFMTESKFCVPADSPMVFLSP